MAAKAIIIKIDRTAFPKGAELWDGMQSEHTPNLGTELRIANFDPDSFREQANPNYQAQEVMGRSEPYQSYMSTSERIVSFTAHFHVGADPDYANATGTDLELIMQQVMRPVRFLDALQYPMLDLTTGITHAPPVVACQIGRLLTARCVVKSIGVEYQSPVDPETLLPHGATVAVELLVVRRMTDTKAIYPVDGQWV